MTTQSNAAVLRCPGCDGVGIARPCHGSSLGVCLHCAGAGLLEAPDRNALKAHFARSGHGLRRVAPFQPVATAPRSRLQP